MPKPSSPSRAPRNAPQRKAHRYIDALATDDCGRLSMLTPRTAHAIAKKKVDAASQSLQLRTEAMNRKARRADAREHAAAERGLQAELREGDHRNRLLWRVLKTKVRADRPIRHTPPKARKRSWPHAAVALPSFDGPITDRNGERGVFARFRYYSRKTGRAGVSQRVVLYCYNGAALDDDAKPYAASNVGETIDEALCAFDHLEQVNWAARENAKLLMHGILAVDHRQTPDEMMACGRRWAEETLGRFDLPYLVTLHAPPEDGDQRNWHLHILWSFRPLVRTGEHEWQVAEMLRTDLDNPKAIKVFREMFAAVMTDMSFEAGQDQVWTAKSNADRGLPYEPQIHLGAARTNRARNGEHVAANEENHERVMRAKAAVIDDVLRHADEALARAQDSARAIVSRWARTLELPLVPPEPVVVAAAPAALPGLAVAARPVVASIALPGTEPATIIGSAARTSIPPALSQPAISRTGSTQWMFAGAAKPPAAPLPVRVPEIAILRFHGARTMPTTSAALLPVISWTSTALAGMALPELPAVVLRPSSPAVLPQPRASLAGSVGSAAISPTMLPSSKKVAVASLPRIVAAARTPNLAPVQRPLAPAAFDDVDVDAVARRLAILSRRDEGARREQERAKAATVRRKAEERADEEERRREVLAQQAEAAAAAHVRHDADERRAAARRRAMMLARAADQREAMMAGWNAVRRRDAAPASPAPAQGRAAPEQASQSGGQDRPIHPPNPHDRGRG